MMNLTKIGKGKATRVLYGAHEEKTIEHNGHVSHSWNRPRIGIEYGEVEVLIDIDAIADSLGNRALKSKSGKSILAGGLIEVRVISRRKDLNDHEWPDER